MLTPTISAAFRGFGMYQLYRPLAAGYGTQVCIGKAISETFSRKTAV
jgi:hypothetical protein